MDYKEKYEQALERARQFSEKPYLEDSAGIVEYIFPELVESEDEKIRKAIIEGFLNYSESFETFGGLKVGDIIAWLEKQGEQKPTEWSEEDEKYINDLIDYMSSKHIYEDTVNWLKSLKDRVQPQPRHEWSEEDEGMRINLIQGFEMMKDGASSDTIKALYDNKIAWLKSLRPQSTWKPSDEQMNALSVAVKHGQTDDPDALKKLLEQLKKLKEE